VAANHTTLKQAAGAFTEDRQPSHLALQYGLALAETELAWLDSTIYRLLQQSLPLEVVTGDSVS
jgi:hypothetical protein